MHHYGYGPEGELLHYCPTGFEMCTECGEVRIAYKPKCKLWGKPEKKGK